MPQLTAFSLNDRETVPVAHAFVPNGAPGGVGKMVRSNGIPVGNEVLTLSTRPVGKRYKGKIVIAVPVVQTQTINGVSTPTVVRTAYIECNTTFDETSTEQERANVVGMLYNALAPSNTVVNSTLVKLEYVSG
jgi:hypothetical protein